MNFNTKILFKKSIQSVPITTLYTLLIRVFGTFLLFYITYILTHNFSVAEVGSYDFSRSLLLFIAVISIFGNDQIILFFSGKLKENLNKGQLFNLYANCLLITSIVSILLFLLAYLFINNLSIIFSDDIDTQSNILKTFFIVFFYSVAQFNMEFMRAIDKPIISELYRNVFKYLFFYFGIIITISFNLQYSLVNVFLFSFIFVFIFSFLPIIKFLVYNYKKDDSKISFKEIFNYTYPITVSNLSIVFFSTLDIFLIKFFLNEESLAYYALCIKLITIPSIIIMSFNTNISIQISHLFTTKKIDTLQKLITDNSRVILCLCLPIVFLLIFLSETILRFFGEEYTKGKNALIILAIGQIVNCFFGTLYTYTSMTNKQKFYQKILVGMIFFNLGLNYFLIPKYGFIGCAITNSSCLFLYTVLMVYYIYKKDRVLISIIK